jgi:hypothetical protein
MKKVQLCLLCNFYIQSFKSFNWKFRANAGQSCVIEIGTGGVTPRHCVPARQRAPAAAWRPCASASGPPHGTRLPRPRPPRQYAARACLDTHALAARRAPSRLRRAPTVLPAGRCPSCRCVGSPSHSSALPSQQRLEPPIKGRWPPPSCIHADVARLPERLRTHHCRCRKTPRSARARRRTTPPEAPLGPPRDSSTANFSALPCSSPDIQQGRVHRPGSAAGARRSPPQLHRRLQSPPGEFACLPSSLVGQVRQPLANGELSCAARGCCVKISGLKGISVKMGKLPRYSA